MVTTGHVDLAGRMKGGRERANRTLLVHATPALGKEEHPASRGYRVVFADRLDRITPAPTSWWQHVPRSAWQAAVMAQQPRLSRSRDGIRLATQFTV
jgi:hypothetical protein